MDAGSGYFYRNALVRYQILMHFAQSKFSSPNCAQYYNLLNYRRITSHLGSKIDFIKLEVPDRQVDRTHHLVDKLIIDIGVLVRHLKKRDTSIVFTLNDGSCAFAVPFGISTHPILCLFILDPRGNYHLRIFNKGLQPDDNPFVKNNIEHKFYGNKYVKNDILIKNINPNFLFCPSFLSAMIRGRCTDSGTIDDGGTRGGGARQHPRTPGQV